MPEARGLPWHLLLAAVLAVTAVAAQGAGQAWDGALAAARAGLGRDDGIAAEMELRRAMDLGAPRPAVAALMGEAFLAQGDVRKAREWLAPGQFTAENAALGFRNLGRLERMEGNLPQAGQAYDKALALTPKDAMLWVDIGRLRYAGAEHLAAIEAVEHALALDAANVRAIEFKGQIVRDREGASASLPWFERGLTLAPEDRGLLLEYAATLGEAGRAKEMLAVTRRMIEADSRDPRPFFLQAVMAARADRIDVARSLMNRTGGRLSEVPAALLLEGILELRAGNPDVAVAALDKLVRRQPGNARARLLLARALAAAGEDLYLVRRFADEASRPDAPAYLQTLVARAYENLGQRDKAAPLLDLAARAGRPFVSPAGNGSQVGALLASGRVDEAQAVAARALAERPGSADALAQAGDAALAQGQGDAAYGYYVRAGAIRFSESLFLRAIEALSIAGRGDEAVQLTRAFLFRHPESRATIRLSAGLAAQAGDWPRARALLEYLVQAGSTMDARLWADLSLARLRTGDPAGAAEAGERGWRLQRANPVVAQAWGMALAAGGKDPARARALLEKARATGGMNPLLAEGFAALEAGRRN